jgi:hypothetical protein
LRAPDPSKGPFSRRHLAVREAPALTSVRRQATTPGQPTTHRPPDTARLARSSEPILFPKLRICFADFPYLHFSNDQRLFTLETCCGYGYGLARKSLSLTCIFKGPPRRTGHRKSRGALRWRRPYLRLNRFQGLAHLNKKRQLFPGSQRASASSFALPP